MIKDTSDAIETKEALLSNLHYKPSRNALKIKKTQRELDQLYRALESRKIKLREEKEESEKDPEFRKVFKYVDVY